MLILVLPWDKLSGLTRKTLPVTISHLSGWFFSALLHGTPVWSISLGDLFFNKMSLLGRRRKSSVC